MEFRICPIGTMHTPFAVRHEMPIQAARSSEKGEVEVFPEFSDGLDGLEGFSHIILLYRFHKAEGYSLRARPFLDDAERGVFAIRTPHRPNYLGLSVVEFLGRRGCSLAVRGVDMLDGTPLIDIKPFVPAFDNRANARYGWLEGKL